MSDELHLELNRPWLVAVWPGMGRVAVNAGYFLLSGLGMELVGELDPRELFDVDHVDVNKGLMTIARRPLNRFFLWRDPNGGHDIVVFLGEAQPPVGRYAFCQRLIEFARQLGVERVFTFAAMATDMHPQRESRVFGATTDEQFLGELQQLEVEVLESGHVSGLNGVLPGVAAEAGLQGTCLLGEMPHIFSQMPFPKASLAVLEVFTTIAGTELDLSELREQAAVMDRKLGEALAQIERAMEQGLEEAPSGLEEEFQPETPPADQPLDPSALQRIETLFEEAESDRSRAYELKAELDRLGIFDEYEDRFLDLFSKRE